MNTSTRKLCIPPQLNNNTPLENYFKNFPSKHNFKSSTLLNPKVLQNIHVNLRPSIKQPIPPIKFGSNKGRSHSVLFKKKYTPPNIQIIEGDTPNFANGNPSNFNNNNKVGRNIKNKTTHLDIGLLNKKNHILHFPPKLHSQDVEGLSQQRSRNQSMRIITEPSNTDQSFDDELFAEGKTKKRSNTLFVHKISPAMIPKNRVPYIQRQNVTIKLLIQKTKPIDHQIMINKSSEELSDIDLKNKKNMSDILIEDKTKAQNTVNYLPPSPQSSEKIYLPSKPGSSFFKSKRMSNKNSQIEDGSVFPIIRPEALPPLSNFLANRIALKNINQFRKRIILHQCKNSSKSKKIKNKKKRPKEVEKNGNQSDSNENHQVNEGIQTFEYSSPKVKNPSYLQLDAAKLITNKKHIHGNAESNSSLKSLPYFRNKNLFSNGHSSKILNYKSSNDLRAPSPCKKKEKSNDSLLYTDSINSFLISQKKLIYGKRPISIQPSVNESQIPRNKKNVNMRTLVSRQNSYMKKKEYYLLPQLNNEELAEKLKVYWQLKSQRKNDKKENDEISQIISPRELQPWGDETDEEFSLETFDTL